MLNRIKLLNQNEASKESQELLVKVKEKFGGIPNVFKMMANSSAVLESYLNFSNALSKSKLDVKIAERIALFTAQLNACEYCLAAHSLIAKNTGIEEDEILNARCGKSSDEKVQAALNFTHSILKNAGKIEDVELSAVRAAGFSDEEILEITANVSLNILTNSLNSLAVTQVDFPKVKECACCK